MIRRLAVVVALLVSDFAVAAEVTHVATAGTDEWPVEIDFFGSFVGTQENATIARENIHPSPAGNPGQSGGGLYLATEMSYQSTSMVMPLRAAVGIWHHLELHLNVPIVIDYRQTWGYSSVSNENGQIGGISVDKKPILCPEGPPNAQGLCANGQPPMPLVTPAPNGGNTLPITSDRGGFVVGNIGVGVAWAPISEEDDDTDPTWVLGFDYAAPSAAPMDPTVVSYGPGSPSQVGAIGDKFHHFQPWTALSKRHGILDPYIELYADIPHAAGGVYDNCDNPYPHSGGEPRGASPSQPGGNCGLVANGYDWSQAVTQAQPVYVGGFWFGSEFVAYENKEQDQKVALDLRFITEYHSQALTYTELTDLVQALTYQQDFARLGAQAGIYLRPTKYFELRLNFMLAHDTDHWLTMENLGGGGANCSGASCDVGIGSQAQNPNFDFRYDNPGDRFMLQNSLIGAFTGTLFVSF